MSLFKSHQKSDDPVVKEKASAAPGYELIVFKVPWSVIVSRLEAAASNLSQSKPIAGFRAGHVPVEVARKQYGDQVLLAEAYDLVIPKLFAVEVQAAGLITVGHPKMSFDPQPSWDTDVTVTAEVPVLPKIKLPDWSKIKVQPVKEEVKDEDVAKVLTDLQEYHASEVISDQPAKAGDLVELDYEVKLAGALVEGGSGVGHKAVLGRQHLLPEIEQAVLGMKAGEEKVQPITFAPSHALKIVAGKTTDCRIALKQVFNRQLPIADDELAKKFGPFKTLDELKQRIKNDLQHEAEHRSQQQTEQKLIQESIKETEYGAFPDILITHESHQLLHELEHQLSHQGIKFEDYLLHLKKTKDDLLLDFAQPALERLKAMLLLREVIRQNNLQPTNEEIEAEIKRLTPMTKDPQILQKPEVKENIEASLAQRKALDWLNSKIVET